MILISHIINCKYLIVQTIALVTILAKKMDSGFETFNFHAFSFQTFVFSDLVSNDYQG